jgi:hypothetical protein
MRRKAEGVPILVAIVFAFGRRQLEWGVRAGENFGSPPIRTSSQRKHIRVFTRSAFADPLVARKEYPR